jgi:dTDP-4-amino-4,6-dideoxy-D-galactose acyltransferase
VVERQGTAIGYLTVHVRDTTASIGLIAVDPRFKRQGVGGHLLRGALAWISDRTVSSVTVVTQGHNDESQRFFQNAGFRVISRAVWYHRWLTQRTNADA